MIHVKNETVHPKSINNETKKQSLQFENSKNKSFFRWVEGTVTNRQDYLKKYGKNILIYPIHRTLNMIKTHLNVPLSCTLFLTDKCNFKCIGCSRNVVGVKHFTEMKLETVQKLLSSYPLLHTFCIAGLGEPTLCSDFVPIVDFLQKKNKYVVVVTNGTNVDKLLALSNPPNYILISLYGYDNKSYKENTGVGAFSKVMETYDKARKKFSNIGFSYILKKTNYKDLEKVLALCDKKKPNFLFLFNYLAYDSKSTEDVEKIITVNDTEIINYIDELSLNKKYDVTKPTYADFDKPIYACKSYNYLINLDGEGNIGGCERQLPPDAVFGNILSEKDPFHSSEMNRLRRLQHNNCFAHKECRFCFGNWK